MAIIQGRNGRQYDSTTLKPITPVPHPETRSREELRDARAAQQSEPNIIGIYKPIVDPFAATLKAETRRKGRYWRDSEAGRRFAAEMTEKSEEWQAEQERQRQATEFAASVQPMVDHAERTLAEAEADETVTVAELEILRSNVELARAGSPEYAKADAAWRDTQRAKLEEKAHSKDSAIRELQAERDRILRDAWEREPDPVPQVAAPKPVPPISDTHVAITDDRGRTKIVRRDQLE